MQAPLPYSPPFAQLMPVGLLNATIDRAGVQLGWMKGHACPCTMRGETPGNPDPLCRTCRGRGTYWDAPVGFIGLITYMHTSSAPDEPGAALDATLGSIDRAEPTLTIPSNAEVVWSECGEMDAYVEYQATTRHQSVLNSSRDGVLPYPFGAKVTRVSAYDEATRQATMVPVAPAPLPSPPPPSWQMADGAVLLLGFEPGTSYVVEYDSSPIYVAHRGAGGLVHRRPFGQGASLPVRFHLTDLDLWTRQRFGGDGPQGFGIAPQMCG